MAACAVCDNPESSPDLIGLPLCPSCESAVRDEARHLHIRLAADDVVNLTRIAPSLPADIADRLIRRARRLART